jgi:hypothetical protein
LTLLISIPRYLCATFDRTLGAVKKQSGARVELAIILWDVRPRGPSGLRDALRPSFSNRSITLIWIALNEGQHTKKKKKMLA